MCGVIGFVSERPRADLGLVAAELLKTLEYRGYDSTGAAVQGDGEEIVLRKGVGAPSVMVEKLGIVGLAGSILCGQVRWATFGSIDDANAQPHEVRCKTHLYGAHNGNVTNCDDLKAWLSGEGHEVLSDNDGEMVVHAVEHFFARELAAAGEPREAGLRRGAMRAALVKAAQRLEGSYAAVVVDPVSRTLWAVKQGSSLYFGIGRQTGGGKLALASSDLSSVLKLTHVLVPLSEGELVEYTAEGYQVHGLAAGARLDRHPTRSRLRASDAALVPPFTTFMEQEIVAQEETCRRIHELLHGGSQAARTLAPRFEAWSPEEASAVEAALHRMRDEYDDDRIRERFAELTGTPAWKRLVASVPPSTRDALLGSRPEEGLASQEAGLFAELMARAEDPGEVLSARLLDALVERDEIAEFGAAADAFVAACSAAVDAGGRVLVVCCGSSFNAALAGSVFFNELAGTELIPVLPGEFRGRFAASLRASDLVIAVSQSGETKDVIDVLNLVIRTGLPVRRFAIVNNVSSTIGQEKCDAVLPLRCGPEIAVPATKSLMNQVAMLYGLALRLGKARGRDVAGRLDRFEELPRLIRETLAATRAPVEEAARLLFLRPSMHILATRLLAVAKEGALKVREVVLNHAEGFEGSEFKHGPNTILGVSTIFGIDDVARLCERLARQGTTRLTPEALETLYQDYPLVFVTGPDETDVNLTVSQVNTHKIRGTACVMIAEENAALRQAVMKAPSDNPDYRSVYVPLPRTDDNLMVVFSATVVLQRLALRMSQMKQEYLDRLGFVDHGVHPDVPKNVSKSITVD